MNICMRYYCNSSICEDFLTFLPVYDLTGKALAKSILDTLKGYNLNLEKFIKQGYDGASAMSRLLALLLRMCIVAHIA